MQYVLLLYASETEPQCASEAQSVALDRDRLALAAELAQGGRACRAHALVSTASATTVRMRGGRTLLSDGPFAQTREQLHGVLVIEARDLDEAIAIAERAPDVRLGSVEIRPVRDLR